MLHLIILSRSKFFREILFFYKLDKSQSQIILKALNVFGPDILIIPIAETISGVAEAKIVQSLLVIHRIKNSEFVFVCFNLLNKNSIASVVPIGFYSS